MEDIKCPICGGTNWIRPEENGDTQFPSTPAVRKCGNPKCSALHPIDAMIDADGIIFDMDERQIITKDDLKRMK